MSHTEMHQEIDEWEVEVCDYCGHEKSAHYPENGYNYSSFSAMNEEWDWIGCCAIDMSSDKGRRLLKSKDGTKTNPYPRCNCMKFV